MYMYNNVRYIFLYLIYIKITNNLYTHDFLHCKIELAFDVAPCDSKEDINTQYERNDYNRSFKYYAIKPTN